MRQVQANCVKILLNPFKNPTNPNFNKNTEGSLLDNFFKKNEEVSLPAFTQHPE
jgi:hypothetical protein